MILYIDRGTCPWILAKVLVSGHWPSDMTLDIVLVNWSRTLVKVLGPGHWPRYLTLYIDHGTCPWILAKVLVSGHWPKYLALNIDQGTKYLAALVSVQSSQIPV